MGDDTGEGVHHEAHLARNLRIFLIVVVPAGDLDEAVLTAGVEGLASGLVTVGEAVVHDFDEGELLDHELGLDVALSGGDKSGDDDPAFAGGIEDGGFLGLETRCVGTVADEGEFVGTGKPGAVADVVESEVAKGVEGKTGADGGCSAFEGIAVAAEEGVGAEGEVDDVVGPAVGVLTAEDAEALVAVALDEPLLGLVADVLDLDLHGLGSQRLHVVVATDEEGGASEGARVVGVAVNL